MMQSIQLPTTSATQRDERIPLATHPYPQHHYDINYQGQRNSPVTHNDDKAPELIPQSSHTHH
jgi:hypothetical protein